MRTILERSGISAGGAYNYFASKADIVRGIVEEERADIDRLADQLEHHRNPLEGLADLVAAIIRYTGRDEAILAMEIYAEACRNPEIGALTEANDQQLRSAIQAAVQRGVEAELIRSEFPAPQLTRWIVALYEGHIGLIATDSTLKPRQSAKVAKESVRAFLAAD